MPDVVVSTVPCPMCGVKQPASMAYKLECPKCLGLGLLCCFDYSRGGVIDGTPYTETICLACKEKEAADGK